MSVISSLPFCRRSKAFSYACNPVGSALAGVQCSRRLHRTTEAGRAGQPRGGRDLSNDPVPSGTPTPALSSAQVSSSTNEKRSREDVPASPSEPQGGRARQGCGPNSPGPNEVPAPDGSRSSTGSRTPWNYQDAPVRAQEGSASGQPRPAAEATSSSAGETDASEVYNAVFSKPFVQCIVKIVCATHWGNERCDLHKFTVLMGRQRVDGGSECSSLVLNTCENPTCTFARAGGGGQIRGSSKCNSRKQRVGLLSITP